MSDRLRIWTVPLSCCVGKLIEGSPRHMTSLFQILMMILSIVKFVVIAHIIMSWLISFGVLNIQQQLVAQIWSGLSRLVEPVYGRIRRFLPDLGGLDLAPLIVILGVFALETILRNNAMMFI